MGALRSPRKGACLLVALGIPDLSSATKVERSAEKEALWGSLELLQALTAAP